MLGDFVNRMLILLLGYAYPAFECFKTVEKNKVQIDELRFWCQYWIIVVCLTVFERVGDIFVSWLPMYGEMKLCLFIYLWYPGTKGSSHVYANVLRPFMLRHETTIDRKIQELRTRAWDFALYYWQNFAEVGQAKFFETLQYLARQSQNFKNGDQKSDKKNPEGPSDSFRSQAGKNDPNNDLDSPNKSKVQQLQDARLNLRRAKPQN